MKKFGVAAAALIATAQASFAFSGNTFTPVPEISALEGTAAIAAVAAIVLLAWERRRRA